MKRTFLVLVFIGIMAAAYGIDSPRPSLLLVDGQPWAAWVERSGAVTVGRVARWTGTGWVRVGGVLNTDPALTVASVVLAQDPQGGVWAAWGEKPPHLTGKDHGSGLLHVARWSGGAWSEPATSPSRSDKTVSERPVLRFDARGRPWVLWSEITPDFNVENVYLAVLEGRDWTLVDNGSLTTDVSSASRSRDLVLLPDSQPLLAYSKLIYRHDFQVFVGPWDGSHWQGTGGARNLNPDAWAGFPSLALDAGLPIVAFLQAGDSFRLVVQRKTIDGWRTLGAPGGAGARNARLAVGTLPVLAWIEPGIGLRSARWIGSEWQELGGAISSPGAFVDTAELALDAQGQPWILWAEDDARGQRLGLVKWVGDWVALPPPPFQD